MGCCMKSGKISNHETEPPTLSSIYSLPRMSKFIFTVLLESKL